MYPAMFSPALWPVLVLTMTVLLMLSTSHEKQPHVGLSASRIQHKIGGICNILLERCSLEFQGFDGSGNCTVTLHSCQFQTASESLRVAPPSIPVNKWFAQRVMVAFDASGTEDEKQFILTKMRT